MIFPYTTVYIYLIANLPAENMLDSRVRKLCYEVKFYLNVWSQENIIPLLNSAVWTNRQNSLLIRKYGTLFTALEKLQEKGFYNSISCNSLRVQMHFVLEVSIRELWQGRELAGVAPINSDFKGKNLCVSSWEGWALLL